MDWAQKQKIIYATGFATIIILLAAYPAYKLISKPATCFDKKQNGTETGIDCGGVCALMCAKDVKSPRVVWAKALPINGNVYDVGVYMENVNTNSGIKNARYTIRVIGNDGSVLAEKNGVTEIAPASRVLLFETGVSLVGTPSRVDVLFESEDLARWTKATTEASPVVTKNQELKNVDTKPRFDATLVNTDPVNDVKNLTLSAIVYDTLRYPVAISKTFVERIPKQGEQGVFFTWPSRFTKHTKGEMCAVPVDTILMIDRSVSTETGRTAPVVSPVMETAKNAAKAYVDLGNIGDKFGLVTFMSTSSSMLDQELSSEFSSLKDEISTIEIKKGGVPGTNLGDALNAALAEFQSVRHLSGSKKAILLFTDGNVKGPIDPTTPKNKQYAGDYAASVAAAAKSSGVSIYTFGVGKKINETFLRERIAGGTTHYFSTSTPEILQTIYKNTSEEACPPENFITEIVITPRAIFAE